MGPFTGQGRGQDTSKGPMGLFTMHGLSLIQFSPVLSGLMLLMGPSGDMDLLTHAYMHV